MLIDDLDGTNPFAGGRQSCWNVFRVLLAVFRDGGYTRVVGETEAIRLLYFAGMTRIRKKYFRQQHLTTYRGHHITRRPFVRSPRNDVEIDRSQRPYERTMRARLGTAHVVTTEQLRNRVEKRVLGPTRRIATDAPRSNSSQILRSWGLTDSSNSFQKNRYKRRTASRISGGFFSWGGCVEKR